MAITPSQWSHVLTIPESYTPTAATSGQTLVITESVIAKLSAGDQSTFWSNVQNGGGDVRICTDLAGTNQLPVEIISLDNAAKTCVIWTRKATYAGTGELYVFIGKAVETKAPDTDPFGRNAVWVDYFRKMGGSTGLEDVTGSGGTTTIGTVVSGQKIKGLPAAAFNDSLLSFDNSIGSLSFSDDFYLSAWVRYAGSSFPSFSTIIGKRLSNRWNFHWRIEGSQTALLIGSASPNSTSNLLVNEDYHLGIRVSSNTITYYINGVASNTQVVSGSRDFPSVNLTVGGIDETERIGFEGIIGQAGAIDGNAKTEEYIATEYANQNDPASFYGTPTIQTTGGGGAVEQSISTSSINSLENFGTSSLGRGTVFLQPPSLTSSEVLGTPSLEEAGVVIQPSSVNSQEFVDSPSVDVGLVFVNALSIPFQEIIGQPSLDKLLQEVIASSLLGQSQIGRPSVEGGDKIAIPVLQRYTYQSVREHLLSLGFEFR